MAVLMVVLPTLILLMFCLGLDLIPTDFLRLVRRPRAIGVGLACQVFGLPCLAAGVAAALELPPVAAVGLILIACCPSGATSNTFTMLVHGDVALAVTLTAFSSVLSLLTLPLVVGWALRHYLATGVALQLPAGKLMAQYAVTVLLPMGLGMALRMARPARATALYQRLRPTCLPLLIVMILVFVWDQRSAIGQHAGALGLATVALVLAGMALGAMASRLARLQPAERRAIVIEVGLQNAAQAMAVAVSPFLLNDARFAVPAVVYVVVMNLATLGYLLALRRRSLASARPGADGSRVG